MHPTQAPRLQNTKGKPIAFHTFGKGTMGVSVAGMAVLRFPPLTSLEAAQAFLRDAGQLDTERRSQGPCGPFPLRGGLCQLASPVTEWESIADEHTWLSWLTFEEGLSAQMAHYLLVTEPLISPDPAPYVSEFLLKDLAKLVKLKNVDALEMYCYWLSEEIEVLLEKIPLEAMDSYTLEAHFKDFIHEVRSSLIRNNELELVETALRLGSLKGLKTFPMDPNKRHAELEKQLIIGRSEGRRWLVFQQRTLAEIAHVIDVIQDAHPDLVLLKHKASLLAKLLGHHIDLPEAKPLTWLHQLLLVAMLHDTLGVVSGVQSAAGIARTNVAFAVQLALALMKEKHPVHQLVSLVLDWENAPAALANEFRTKVVEVLELSCEPFTAKLRDNAPLPTLNDVKVNPLFLDLLPENAILHNEDGKPVKVHLKSADALTKAGQHILRRILA